MTISVRHILVCAEEELGPLPAGRHGFSREQVAHNQRERLIAARDRGRRARLQRRHDHPHHQGRLGLPSRLLRELRGQGGVLSGGFRGGGGARARTCRRRRRVGAGLAPSGGSGGAGGACLPGERAGPGAAVPGRGPECGPGRGGALPRCRARTGAAVGAGERGALGRAPPPSEHGGLDGRRPRLARRPQGGSLAN